MMIDYDLIIIGSGPAGMNACLYASRSNLKTLVIEKNYPGGKIVKATKIENWIGTQSIEGPELALNMFKHAFSNGGVYEQNNVLDIIDYGIYKEVVLKDKKYKCCAVIICTGTSERKMGIPGEEKFYGKGVSYCAICDGALYKDQTMVVIGNSDYAIEEALYLSKFARKIFIINREDSLAINNDSISKIKDCKIIEVLNDLEPVSINGEENVKEIIVKDRNNIEKTIETNVIFPFIGNSPNSFFASRLGIVDDNGYIQVDDKMETNIKGVYAAGDCTNKPLKQIVTASSDGAIAAIEAYKYICSIKKES